jgi:hypothetical protein
MKHQQQLEFNQGVMKLSAYDPSSKKYETRILRLPEVPFLEPLEYLINNETNKPLRLTKSCNNKRINNHTSTITLTPRRCQSNPNLYKKQQSYQNNAPSIRSKRSLSGAFNAVTGFIQKAAKNKKQKSSTSSWSNETWYDEIRLSSDSSISTLNLNTPSYPTRQTIALSCENWWKSSPPLII